MMPLKVLNAILPVFFMLFLGYFSRKGQWVTKQQNEGAKSLVMNVLFPFLVFKVINEATITSRFFWTNLYVDIAWIILFVIGSHLTNFTGKKYAHVSPFLLMTSEGGSVALPLYLTLVSSAYAINIVTFDVGGILINFGLVPAIIAKRTSGQVSWKKLFKDIISSPFIIAVIIGLISNLSGFHRMAVSTQIGQVYTSTMEMVTGPIVGIMLFTIGYDLKFDKSLFQPLLKLALVRIGGCLAIIAGFFVFFPSLVTNKEFIIAILLYFACPPGFPVPLQVKPLVKSEDDETFMSAFISLFMIIVLIAYIFIAIAM